LLESAVIQKIDQRVILQQDQVRILHWDTAVVVRRDNARKIPLEVELIAKAKVSLDDNNVIDAVIVEQIMDKLIHNYFHFLVNNNKETKSHFYNGYLVLTSAMAKLGHSQAHFKEIKSIATEKKFLADQFVKGIKSRKDDVPGLMSFRELSRQYEQFRTEHTAFGEHVNSIFSELVKHWNVQLY
jgi:hypothetical protein